MNGKSGFVCIIKGKVPVREGEKLSMISLHFTLPSTLHKPITHTMHFQHTIFCALAFALLLLTPGEGIAVQFGHDPKLDDPSNPSNPTLKARDLSPYFFENLDADTKPSSSDANLAQRGIKVRLPHDPAFDDPHPSDSDIGSRDFETLSADAPDSNKNSDTEKRTSSRQAEV